MSRDTSSTRKANFDLSKLEQTERQRIKSPIVKIDLRSGSDEKEASEKKDGEDNAEEHIANMPDTINDSMMGDLNQLISDLNNGKQHSSGKQMSSNRKTA